ncbi:MAG: Fic family protein [Bdellovibrionaceae bacterium]|nr:Fic family protein [Pseudobdellovibrionaceae bacterium]
MNYDDAAVRKSLQRALKSLVGQNKIEPKGKARATIYFLSQSVQINNQDTAETTALLFNEMTLSKEGKKLLNYISLPITKRDPVGYNQAFLEDYIPNKSSYLTNEQKNALLALGQVEPSQKPAGTYARDIYQRLIIDLSWNSSRLEGNTYSILETQRLIELGEAADGKNSAESQMILNHKAAIEFLIDSADEIDFNKHTICNVHALLSDNLLGDPSAPGKIREKPVQISGSTYLPIDNPHLLRQMFELFLKKVKQIENPFEQSFFTLVHLSYLQTFEDVNKRTSRITANIPLFKKNLRPLAFVDVDQKTYLKALLGIYEKNDVSLLRDLFLWAYKRSTQRYSAIQQSLGEPNLLKLKYRAKVQEIIQTIIKNKTPGKKINSTLISLVEKLNISSEESKRLLEILEVEILSLHEGNFARYQIRPSEFKAWEKLK